MTINRSLPIWTVRFLLAALFLFASEIILWTVPIEHSPLEWLIRGFGYLLLATLTLDIAQRYRIRDGFDAMILLAGTALISGLLINPLISWELVPDSLLIRIIGGDALVMLIMWGIFLAWMRGDVRKYWWQQAIGTVWLGIFWGFWMRWTPELNGTFEAIPLNQMFMITGITFTVIVLFYLLVIVQSGKNIEADDVMLTNLEWAIALLVMIVLFLVQAVQQNFGAGAFLVTALVLALCWLILWLRRDAEETSILDTHLPLKMQNPLWIILMMASFVVATYLSYHAPLITDLQYVNQLWLMEIGSFAVGILWLPIVASVIATRAVDRYMREGATI